ncbi:hypothetical protein T4E_11595 [Trichinella pseudospiralis]|uniref:Uncharacterized protein n=1 Tax=Trichinella pseudospiralis TaxID=6337 RepID=A0A0V0YNJ0_TRIPS|nr:hypothetical protein T4E_11595 [Trichinella pseudospiralis]
MTNYHELAISYNLYTNLDASEVIRTSEHAEGCRVNVHAFYHQQQLSELKRLAAEDPRPVSEIYDELASNVTTSLDTAAYFPSRIFEVLHSKAEELGVQLDPAKFVCNFERALIPAIQVLQSPLSQYPGARLFLPLLPSCASAAFLPVNLVLAGFEILNVKTSDPVEALFEYFQREWLPAIKIPLWNVHGVVVRTNNHLEC